MAAGEAPISIAPLAFLITKQAAGAPVQVLPISPVGVNSYGAAVVKKTPHPNAAKLWVSWLASPEARKLLDAQAIGYAAACNGSPVGEALCKAGVKPVFRDIVADAENEKIAREKIVEALGTKAN